MNKNEGSGTMSRRDFLRLSLAGGAGLFAPEFLLNTVSYISHGDRDSNKIAMTIDDGWYPEKVERALELLDGTPASFFIVGACLHDDPKLYAKAIDKGYEIYNHTLDHTHLNNPTVDISYQIKGWEQAYSELNRGEFVNKLMRAPANQGVDDTSVYNTLGGLGYKAIMGWTYGSPGVYSRYSTQDVIDFVVPKMAGGDIILMHFTDSDVGAIPAIKQAAKDKGLELVGLTGLPGMPIYTPKPKELVPQQKQPSMKHTSK